MRLSDILKKKQTQQPHVATKWSPVGATPPLTPPAETPKSIIQRPHDQTFVDSTFIDSRKIYGKAIKETRDIFGKIISSKTFEMPEFLVELIEVAQKEPHKLLIHVTRTTPDSYIYSHSVNVCILASTVANCLNYSSTDITKLAAAALLHDVGMVGYINMVSKKGKLSDEEFEKVKQHPATGQNIIDKMAVMPSEIKTSVLSTILQIHERVNGSGYPKGLSGEKIDEHAKIIAICDTYEAMTHPRNYRDSEIPHNAIKNLINLSRENFDTEIMKCFINMISLYPVGSYIRLSNNEIAKVIKINTSMPTRPTVNIALDPQGKKARENNIVNLEEVSIIAIKEAVDETRLKIDPKIALEFQSQKWWLKGI